MSETTNQSMPIGTVVAFGGNVDMIPAGWLLCDGQEFHRDTYQELYKVISGGFGLDGVKFRVPDLRGRWVRGVSADSGRDPAAAAREAMNPGGNTGNKVGSVQAEVGNSLHKVESRLEGGARSVAVPIDGNWSEWLETGGQYHAAQTSTRFRANAGETRVKNAFLHYIIRAH